MARNFQELTIKDAFMFAAVMSNAEQCQKLLEMALDMKILSVTVITEKTLSFHPDYHGVRLDVLAEENGTKRRFNVEMQVERPKSLPQRTRYYHSLMDIDLLIAGVDYAQLPNTYVIFICDFSPFDTGQPLYRYTFRSRCDEDGRDLNDGYITIILNTKGENDKDVPEELMHFLKYIRNPDNISDDTANDPYVHSLENSIAAIKSSRSWEAKFMLLEELMEKEHAAGREEGRKRGREEGREEGRKEILREYVFDFLKSYGELPEDIRTKINTETDEAVLKKWHTAAAKASSMEAFIKNM